MPANFGEIADYHRQEAARLFACAQAARERESYNEAEYLAGMAARHAEAAQEQKMEMREEPCPSIAQPRTTLWPPEPPSPPFAAVCWLAMVHAVGKLAAAIRQFLSRRNARGFSHRL